MELLWKYIEGNCDEAELATVEQLLEADKAMKAEWLQRKTLHESLQHLEMDTPSMRFVQNVMDSLPRLYESSQAVSMRWLRRFAFATGTITAIFVIATFSFDTSGMSNPAQTNRINNFINANKTIAETLTNDYALYSSMVIFAALSLILLDQWLSKQSQLQS